MHPQTELIKIFRSEYLCPISMEAMKNPVIDVDGVSYQAENIYNWFKNNDTSPVTKQRLESKQLIPNYYLKDLIQKIENQVPKILLTIDSMKNKISQLTIENQRLQQQIELKFKQQEESHIQAQLEMQMNIPEGQRKSKRLIDQVQAKKLLDKRKSIKKLKFQQFFNTQMSDLYKKQQKLRQELKEKINIQLLECKKQLQMKTLQKNLRISQLQQQLEFRNKEIDQLHSGDDSQLKIIKMIDQLREDIETSILSKNIKYMGPTQKQLRKQVTELKADKQKLIEKIQQLQRSRIFSNRLQMILEPQDFQKKSKVQKSSNFELSNKNPSDSFKIKESGLPKNQMEEEKHKNPSSSKQKEFYIQKLNQLTDELRESRSSINIIKHTLKEKQKEIDKQQLHIAHLERRKQELIQKNNWLDKKLREKYKPKKRSQKANQQKPFLIEELKQSFIKIYKSPKFSNLQPEKNKSLLDGIFKQLESHILPFFEEFDQLKLQHEDDVKEKEILKKQLDSSLDKSIDQNSYLKREVAKRLDRISQLEKQNKKLETIIKQ